MIIKKILSIGIIILFFSSTFLSVTSAIINDTDYIDNETSDKYKIRSSNNYEEIITFVKGWVDLNWIERRGFFRGEAMLICRYKSGFINLSGYRRSENGVEYFNESIEKGLIYVYHLICSYVDYSYGFVDPRIVGIAIGNIIWEEY